LLTNQEELLSGIVDMAGLTKEQAKQRVIMRPLSGFTVSNLFTGSNTDLSLDGEIERDIQTADEIYWIVAFVRFSCVRIFENALREFLAKPNAKLRLITTTYMGASEPKAVDFLKQLAPNKVEIKVSYNCDLDRLHAKSYIFVRESGLNTAYIGSSNMSRSALTKGLEWNMRITNQENPHIIQKALATFDTYWNSDNFEDYDYDRFVAAIAERNEVNRSVGRVLQKYHVLPHQKAILDKLTVEREIHQSYKNLIVAATGTGKTVIAAFDYKRFYDANQRHRLLFVAHRK
jgi:HKD family nuclease